jgi:hypothetical protein
MPLSAKPVVSWSNCCDGAAAAPAASNSRHAPASQPLARARAPLCLVAVTFLLLAPGSAVPLECGGALNWR